MNKHTKRAELTHAETRVWEQAFSDYIDHYPDGTIRADKFAWKEVQTAFPRLRKYAGCRP